VFLPFWQVRLDSLAGYKGIHYCVWIPVLCGWIPPNIVHQLIQLAVPLAVGWWFVRHSHNYGKAQLAS
jgi:hypothetical protein